MPQATMKTIEVDTTFGTKDMTKGEYTDKWTQPVLELLNLSSDNDFQAEMIHTLDIVKAKAKQSFEDYYLSQNAA